jgi:large subunit ribosomal protein L13
MAATKTYVPKVAEIERRWFVVDAEGQTLGRLATQIATILRGKHKPIYTPHLDVGDYVIVVNAEKVEITGGKEQQKQYYRHSGYPGGIYQTSYQDMLRKHPERVIESAVKGMLPHTNLGRDQLKKLKVYAGPTHPHAAQQPVNLTFEAAARK